MSAQHSRLIRHLTVYALLGASMAGCAVTEQNPLNVNDAGPGDQTIRDTAVTDIEPSGTAPADPSAPAPGVDPTAGSFIAASLDDDPLNIRADGATLCGVQPKDSFLEYTIMLHNPTLQSFTFDSIELGNTQGLRKIDAKITPANREGHGNHGASPTEAGGHGGSGHDATPTPTPSPTEPSTFSVEPVPAVGYQFEPDQHINIVVSVALEESVTRGTADDVIVNFSAPGQEFSVPHDLNITIDKTTCS